MADSEDNLPESQSNFAVRLGSLPLDWSGERLAGSLGRPTRRRDPTTHDKHNDTILWSVIGDDDELTTLFTRDMPERLICSLIIHARGQEFHGSGWLAGPDFVITCGHNVHHDDFGGWAERIEVIPGRSEEERPFGQTEATRFSAHQHWIGAHDPAADIGCLHLDAPIGERLGWFAVARTANPQALVGLAMICAGYPEYQGEFSRQRRGDGAVAAIDRTRLYHTADTNDGESGGPIWLKRDGDAPPTAIAVHTYEAVELAGPPRQLANSGTLIDASMLALITQWRGSRPN